MHASRSPAPVSDRRRDKRTPLKTCAIVIALLVLALTAWQRPADAAPASSLPNVVFILADDFGYADLACYGHPYAKTPSLDQLAAEGTRFEQFYSTGITCCPARTGLMTSKFCATYRVYPAAGGFGNRVTVTELLKKRGYRTGHFGKWHIGPDESSGTYGIDTIGAGEDPKGGKRRDDRGRDAHIFDEAIAFVERNRDAPFYMNIWGHISHNPIDPPQSYIDKFADVTVRESDFAAPMQEKFKNCKDRGGDLSEHMRAYLGDVLSMDEAVGRLLKRIDELGLRENTIVVFSSDQGPAPLRSEANDKKSKNSTELKLNTMGYAGNMRGGKHGMFEGGVCVPFIVRWPGRVPSGRVDAKSVISGVDWLPTLCAIAGVKINVADFDGEDMSDAWLGKTHVRKKPLLWKTSSQRSEMVARVGDWKLHYPGRKRGDLELYNVPNDRGERQDLSTVRPDIVKNMTALLDAWDATLPTEYEKAKDLD